MPVQLHHIITEMEKLRKQADRKYSQYVNQGSMTIYTKQSKLAVLDEILRCCYEAAKNKTTVTEQFQKLSL